MSKKILPVRYHPVHVVLHWLIFLLVIMTLAIGKLVIPGVSPDDPQKVFMLQAHAYIGMFIGVLLVIRLILRFTVKPPARADSGSPFLNFVANAVHFLLYLFVIGMALSGFNLFLAANLPEVFSRQISYPQDFFQYLPRMAHGLISWLLLGLIVLHFGAAMYHQFFLKDNLLGRMWFGKN